MKPYSSFNTKCFHKRKSIRRCTWIQFEV